MLIAIMQFIVVTVLPKPINLLAIMAVFFGHLYLFRYLIDNTKLLHK